MTTDIKELRESPFVGQMTRREINKALASVGIAVTGAPLASLKAKASLMPSQG